VATPTSITSWVCVAVRAEDRNELRYLLEIQLRWESLGRREQGDVCASFCPVCSEFGDGCWWQRVYLYVEFPAW
jgi:hypothetical protein